MSPVKWTEYDSRHMSVNVQYVYMCFICKQFVRVHYVSERYFSVLAALRCFCSVWDISSRFLLPRKWVPSYDQPTTANHNLSVVSACTQQ